MFRFSVVFEKLTGAAIAIGKVDKGNTEWCATSTVIVPFKSHMSPKVLEWKLYDENAYNLANDPQQNPACVGMRILKR